MLVRSGLPLTIPVYFSTGAPDGVLNWRLYDGLGEIGSGSESVPPGAVSFNLVLPGVYNTLATGKLLSSRDIEWDYTVSGMAIRGELRYDIEARVPFGASPDGVRAKLGSVQIEDLPDSHISLARAYYDFVSVATPAGILAVSDNGGPNDLKFRDAVEAIAALQLIPSMTVRVATSEDSGTNKFKRQAVDWELLGVALSQIIDEGILIALPTYDPAGAGALFLVATPATDAITGSSAGA